MTDPGLDQHRLEWLNHDVRISDDSDTLYFVGCLPYYNDLFQNLGIEGVEIARSAVKILNALGIEPQILADERCCGHDQIWEGDLDTFKGLARLNLESIRRSGARRIVTTCPECARTLGLDYPKLVGEHGMEVLHLSRFLNQQLTDFELDGVIQKMEGAATYHDACRLGRHLGIYEEPRALIMAAGLDLVEMEHARNTALCCGTSCWTSCGKVSKNIQVQRLKEAKATGADLLITTCVKCQIHLKCAQQDAVPGENIAIKIRDLTTVLADCLAHS
jgi:Fe-S oxidoreductase